MGEAAHPNPGPAGGRRGDAASARGNRGPQGVATPSRRSPLAYHAVLLPLGTPESRRPGL